MEVKNVSLTLGTARLFYEAWNRAPDTYLIAFHKKVFPIIIDRISAYTTTIELFDLDSDGLDEVLVFYPAGGNQFQLKGYRLLDVGSTYIKITRIEGMHLSSNMHSIEVLPKKIIVKNQQWLIDDEAVALLTVDEYRYDGGELILERTSKEKLYE